MSFNSKEISSILDKKSCAVLVLALPSTTSTNDVARSLALETDQPVIVVADQQTRGKGSHGRSFYSPGETGFYMSFTVPNANSSIQMTLAAGVATVQAIEETFQKEVRIKWVNDLIYNGKKVSGILCERMADGTVIVGIGINMMSPKGGFPADIADTATALDANPNCINYLAASIYLHYLELLHNNSDILPAYKKMCITLGRTVQFTSDGTEQVGLAYDVEEDGSLIIIQGGKKKKYSSGDISVRAI